ncbi:uncharacterized protein PAC_13709 [Phialocephala subalpina]|uniref:Uncharacterized protein n=1 Tax=Phialocephala subalpina TaxID=576137 RepID=A0A1L7XFK7_9HELO|nr:uncharacterized protein PAC_13709 [Phialocephala subalpina]
MAGDNSLLPNQILLSPSNFNITISQFISAARNAFTVTIVIAVQVVLVASGRVQEVRPLSGVVGDYPLNKFSIPHASQQRNSDRVDDIAARAGVADADVAFASAHVSINMELLISLLNAQPNKTLSLEVAFALTYSPSTSSAPGPASNTSSTLLQIPGMFASAAVTRISEEQFALVTAQYPGTVKTLNPDGKVVFGPNPRWEELFVVLSSMPPDENY